MRRLFALFVIALTACSHFSLAPDRLPGFVERTEKTFTDLRMPGMSIAVVRNGKVVLARGFGFGHAETRSAAEGGTLYPIGSITKTFTSTLMLQLEEERRLDLDAEVRPYVDWEVPAGVRIRHVASHTSEGVPGARFAYSSRFNWLDNVVEAATKENFRALMAARVLNRAKLTRTLPGEEREGYAASLTGLAAPYRVKSDGAVVRSAYPPMALHSSSGLSSTVEDLAKYSIALDEGRLLSPAALRKAYTPAVSTNGETLPYGIGWFSQEVRGERVVWHTSWWPDAYSGLLVKVPSRGLTLVLLANTDGLVAPQGGASNVLLYPIANDFLRTFLGTDPAVTATGLVANALTLRARGDRAESDAVVRKAIDCCERDLAISDDDRLRLFAESSDERVRSFAVAATDRLLAKWPEDLGIKFNAALLYGRVRPALRLSGDEAAKAADVLMTIVDSTQTKPRWMEAWSTYLVAEHIAGRDPVRAKALAERAAATGVDTDGLKARVAALVTRLK